MERMHPTTWRSALHRRLVMLHARTIAGEEGQATAEYGLVIVAAAGIAAALIAFGRHGFETFFKKVVDAVVGKL